MDILGSYGFIITIAIIVILSYLYNLIAQRTNIPAVLMLIVTGIILQLIMSAMDIRQPRLQNSLEVLGIVGLIMIVLEAALELKLTKEKWPTIWKALSISALGLVGTAFTSAFVINFFYDSMDIWTALLYAIPLSILSSAIIIPSVGNLTTEKKEFHVYESTFSDILGIIFFYLVVGQLESSGGGNPVASFLGNIILTLVIAVVASYALIILFQNLRSQVKLFLLIAILLLLYSIAKMMHLSSLIIILVFGLIMANEQIFFRGKLKQWLKKDALNHIREDFHLVTVETAFVVRTFFFVVFGITISLGSLLSFKVVGLSVCMLLLVYLLRFFIFRLFYGEDIRPQIFIAPRGLITVLLFFAIPYRLKNNEFDQGILLFVIIATSLVMTWALIKNAKEKQAKASASSPPAADDGLEDETSHPGADHNDSTEGEQKDEGLMGSDL